MRKPAQTSVMVLSAVALTAAMAACAIWIRSTWTLDSYGSQRLEAARHGGDRSVNTAVGTEPAGVFLLRQVDEGPKMLSVGAAMDPTWKRFSTPRKIGSPAPVDIRDFWFRVSFTRYSLPAKSGEVLGDHGYTLEVVIPDWIIILVFLMLPAWQLWRHWRSSTQRSRGFDLIGTSDTIRPEAAGDRAGAAATSAQGG